MTSQVEQIVEVFEAIVKQQEQKFDNKKLAINKRLLAKCFNAHASDIRARTHCCLNKKNELANMMKVSQTRKTFISKRAEQCVTTRTREECLGDFKAALVAEYARIDAEIQKVIES